MSLVYHTETSKSLLMICRQIYSDGVNIIYIRQVTFVGVMSKVTLHPSELRTLNVTSSSIIGILLMLTVFPLNGIS